MFYIIKNGFTLFTAISNSVMTVYASGDSYNTVYDNLVSIIDPNNNDAADSLVDRMQVCYLNPIESSINCLLTDMKPSKYVFESHSSMFVCIAGFEPLCSQISGWIETQENHIFMIGAKILDDETVLFRQYVSKDMPETEYNKLVKEIKSGLLSTSIQSLVKWKIEAQDEDDNWIWFAEESVGNERNDIVEWNQTGMAVKTVGTSQKALPVENIKREGVTSMKELDDAIALINETSQKVGSNKKDIAEKLGFSDILITDAQKEKLKTLDEVSAKVCGDLVGFVDKTIASQKENFTSMKEIALKKAFKDCEEAIGIASDLIGDEPMTSKELEDKVLLIAEKQSVKDALGRGADTRTKTTGQKGETSGTKVYAV